ncbi:dienelactone hydrolase family protein [Streptomyces mangrovisoli]|uniref:Hydrolase n=1 Tax=Streptomyces mangrovisoli TaxID=1428628 RepID=A0A1J4P0E0_9ACTN|nr:dienelactone hydrolase family protein [Streptomyces mangrovisoli]OIJ68083.1 hydrolase [Streptomyces mangrovisoli]
MVAESVKVPSNGVLLDGDLAVPLDARGMVLFAHGSGSSRLSPRNRAVAEGLRGAGFATLLLDLLTEAEEREDAVTARLRFDLALLAGRLVDAVDWLGRRPGTAVLPVGLFGASTGAGAALVAAAARPGRVTAVVSRGGRPDLAGDALPRVAAPVLLVVGGADAPVLGLNREAARLLPALHRLHVVPGATHLFPEPGALEQVTEAAVDWFHRHLRPAGPDTTAGESGPADR